MPAQGHWSPTPEAGTVSSFLHIFPETLCDLKKKKHICIYTYSYINGSIFIYTVLQHDLNIVFMKCTYTHNLQGQMVLEKA